MKIEIIAGSPRVPSLNGRVAKFVHQYLQQNSAHETGLIELNKISVPFIQNVWRSAEDAPSELQEIARRIFEADAFILSTPEYNGSYSSAMKNLLDHFPKHKHKAFGIITSSDGIMGGMRAAQQMLQLVPGIFGIASPQLLIVPQANKKFDENGQLTAPEFEKNVHDFVTEFLWLAERLLK